MQTIQSKDRKEEYLRQCHKVVSDVNAYSALILKMRSCERPVVGLNGFCRTQMFSVDTRPSGCLLLLT